MRPRLGLCALIVLLFGSFVLPGNAWANTVYISQNGGTFSGGTACNGQSTQAYTYFNNSANWTSGTPTGNKIGSGTTVYVCGTISNQLAFQGSGTSSNPVTLLFDSGAMLSASGTVWNANSAIYAAGASYIVINGGTSNVGGASTNLQATNNGSGLATSLSVGGIQLDGSSNVTVENFGCGPLYQHTSASDDNPGADTGGCVQANPQGANISIHDSTFHDATDGVFFPVANSGNLNMQVYNMNMYNIDHFLFTSCNSSGSSGFYYHDNQIHDPSNWDTTSDSFHHDGWLLNYNAGQSCSGVYNYNNLFSGNWRANTTSPIFYDNNGGNLTNVYVFNDVFLNTSTTGVWDDGIDVGIDNAGGPSFVWNNTIICGPEGGQGLVVTASNIDMRNNVSSACAVFFNTDEATTATITTFDYNYYADLISSGSPAFNFLSQNTTAGGSLASQFTAWQSIVQALVSGSESHSGESASAGLNSSGVPQSGSPLIGAAVNLCNGIVSCTGALAALASDTSAGNTRTPTARPASGAWTMGAYNYSATTSAYHVGIRLAGGTVE